MIYSASRRTDLVAWFTDTICDRVRRSRKLEAIVFWTKDPRNLIAHEALRAVLDRFPSIIQLTVTGLAGTYWEPHVPPLTAFAPTIRTLGCLLPAGAIQWRFDPIIVDDTLWGRFDTVHAVLAKALGELAEVTVSFPDPYKKVVRRLARDGRSLPVLSDGDMREILTQLHNRSGLDLQLCCEPALLDLPGVYPAHCVDAACIDQLYGTSLAPLPKDAGQRKDCGCVRSTDIGSYELECPHRCRYCYARPAQ